MTKPHIMAFRLLVRVVEKIVDHFRGSFGLALTNSLYDDLKRIRELLTEKPVKRKPRRADD